MRATRILLVSLGALLALALLCAWQVPGRLDWNRYRGTIESLASVTLGRPVTIAGQITLSLLPETELTAADVMVASNEPGQELTAPALTVKALRLRVAPLPLLAGRVDARELSLSGPDISVGWPLQHGELAGWPPYWLSAFSARIDNGRLRVGGLVLEQIAATLETTEAGGLIAVGKGQLGGQPVRFSARLTAAGADGASGLNLTVEAEQRLAGVNGSFVGQLAADGTLAGRLDVVGPDLAQVVAPTDGAAPAGAFKVSAALKAAGDQIRFDDLTLDLAGPNGATALNGAASLRLAPTLRVDARLSTPRLELAPWVSVLGRVGQGGAGFPIGLDLKAEAVAFGGGLMRELSTSLEITQGQIALRQLAVRLPGQADLSLDGVVQRSDPERPRFDGNARLQAPRLREVLQWLDGAGLRLLPNLPDGVLASADFRAHAVAEPGLLALDRIDGRVDGAAVNGELRLWPRSRAGTGGNAPAGGASGGSPAIVASLELARLDLDPWLAALPARTGEPGRGFDVDLRLRAPVARLRGEEIRALSLDAAVQAAVQGPSAPAATSSPPPAKSAQGPALPGIAPASAPPPTPVVVPAGELGRVTLRQLDATVRGVHLVASGMVAEGGRLTEGKLQAITDDASALADLVPRAWRPAEAFWRGPAVLNAQLAGPAEALGLKLALDMADARLEAQPVVDLRSGKWSGPVTLRHPGAPRLLALFGLSGSEAWLGEGSFSMIAQLSGGSPSEGQPSGVQPSGAQPSGTPVPVFQALAASLTRFLAGRVGAELLDLSAGQLRLNASLALDMAGETPSVDGRIQAETLMLPDPAWREAKPMPLALLRGWRANVPVTAHQVLVAREPFMAQASGTLGLADGVLRIQPFAASLNGGALSGTLTVNAAIEPPTLSLTAMLADATVGNAAAAQDPGGRPFDLLAGQVNATAELNATGYSLATMLATLSGPVKLDVTQGVLSGFDLFRVIRVVASADPRTRQAAETALRAATLDGVTSFDRLTIDAEAQSGTLVLRAGSLSGTAGTAEISGSAGLGNRQLDLRVVMHPAIEPPPEIAFRLTGPWEKPRRTMELAGFFRWLGDRKPTP